MYSDWRRKALGSVHEHDGAAAGGCKELSSASRLGSGKRETLRHLLLMFRLIHMLDSRGGTAIGRRSRVASYFSNAAVPTAPLKAPTSARASSVARSTASASTATRHSGRRIGTSSG